MRQHAELEQTVATLDQEETKQMTELSQSVQSDFSSQFSDADRTLTNALKSAEVDEADVQKMIKLHKAQMKEFNGGLSIAQRLSLLQHY